MGQGQNTVKCLTDGAEQNTGRYLGRIAYQDRKGSTLSSGEDGHLDTGRGFSRTLTQLPRGIFANDNGRGITFLRFLLPVGSFGFVTIYDFWRFRGDHLILSLRGPAVDAHFF